MSLATKNIKDEKSCVAKTQDFQAELKLFSFSMITHDQGMLSYAGHTYSAIKDCLFFEHY